jgi:hypothetical protein
VKLLRRHQNLRVLLLLSALLLAAQTLLVWHQHGGKATPDETCQLCLHAQHHTPAPATLFTPATVLFTQLVVLEPAYSHAFHYIYHITIPSRAPPALFA